MINKLVLLIIAALLSLSLTAQKVVGIHLLNYNHNEDLIKLMDDVESLAEKGVNTIFLEIDYHFNFKSHPELIQTDNPITKEVAQKFAKFCNEKGIKIIPQFQSLGHQSWAENTWKLLTVYPELDLTPGAFSNNDSIYCREWDVMNPKVNEIVFPLIDEIIEAFNAEGIHLGMDEVFLLGHPKSPSTRGMDPAFLYGKVVREFHDYFTKKQNKQLYMWGDRLIDGSKYGYGAWEASLNGTHPAIDSIPTDIIICDWHYNPQKKYPSVDLFIEKGFRVLPCSWKSPEAANTLIRYSYAKQNEKMLGHMYTTWGAVKKEELLSFSALNAGMETINGEKFHEAFINQGGFNEKGELLVKLSTSNPNVGVKYTLDGSEPTTESAVYTGPFVFSKGNEVKAVPFKDGELVGSVSSKEFSIHKAIGKRVELITMPSDKYASELQQRALTNGVDLTSAYNDGEWLGFEGNDVQFVIDMEEKQEISSVSINFHNKVNDWIHHPTEVIVLGSKDGKSFEQIGYLAKRKTGRPVVNFTIPTKGKVRFIKIIAKNQIIPVGFNGEGNPAWIFLDEVEVE